MEIIQAITDRRSIRKYSDKKVGKNIILGLISAANWAPSACNLQGWRFIAVDSEELKKRIVDEGGAWFIRTAPVLIVVAYDNRTENTEYRDDIQSASAAIQNMLLAAHSYGLGCCWVCHMPTKGKMREILGIPWNYDPVACITLGYPAGRQYLMKRKTDAKGLLAYNRFNFKEPVPPPVSLRVALGRAVHYIYPRLPRFVKKMTKSAERKVEVKFEN